MIDYIVITLAIIFLLLAIDKMKNALLEQDNNMIKMQKYLEQCEKDNQQDKEFIDYIREIEMYDKIMNNKTYR